MMSDLRTSDYGLPRTGFARRSLFRVIGLGSVFAALSPRRSDGQDVRHDRIRIVTLGDSITKGVRPGVKATDTFAALLEDRAQAAGFETEVVNVGIGGERTDQALARLDKDVLSKSPSILTIMYGANDSYVDPGQAGPRISPDDFRNNLERIIDKAQSAGVRVVLMTEPRWGAKPRPNGLGEHPNLRLEEFMRIVREIAGSKKVPLVDHYAEWTRLESGGLDLATVTTDLLHPNPAGHRLLADSIWPVIEPILARIQPRQ